MDVEADSREQDEIGFLDGHVASAGAEDAHPTCITRVGRRQGVLGAGRHDGAVEVSHRTLESLDSSSLTDTRAGYDERSFCTAPALRQIAHDASKVSTRRRRYSIGGQFLRFDLSTLDVRGDVDPTRARPAGHRQMQGFLEFEADPGWVQDLAHILCDGSGDADGVDLLLTELPHPGMNP